MQQLFQVKDLWRILRQTDLQSIRDEIEDEVRILIVALEREKAEELARLLDSRVDQPGTPLIIVQDAPVTAEQVRALESVGVAILLTPTAALPQPLELSRRALATVGLPVARVILDGENAEQARKRGSWAVVSELTTATVENKIANAILAAATPEDRLALAHHFPLLRQRFFNQLIQETARANAVYSVSTGIAEIIPILNIPLNIGDALVLTKNQLVMSYKIALVAGKEGTPRELMGEIIGVLGGGFLFRQIAREMVGLIPVIGIVPKVAVAYAGTWAIGRAIVLWATEGREVSRDTLRQFYDEAMERGRRFAEQVVESARGGESEGAGGAEEAGILSRIRNRLPFV